jgi:hypothetical protein
MLKTAHKGTLGGNLMKNDAVATKNRKIVRKVLLNLRAIDEMRKEVKRLVPLLSSLVSPDSIRSLLDEPITLTTNTCTWTVRGCYNEAEPWKSYCSAACRLGIDGKPLYQPPYEFKDDCVQRVWESLPAFYEFMTKTFHLDDALQPFLSATPSTRS